MKGPLQDSRRLRFLGWLVATNVLSTVLHYVDNVLSFPEYPEPAWATPLLVDAFWFLMTPFAAAGYGFFARGRPCLGGAPLLAFSAMSLLSLGHCLYAPMCSVSPRINAFILFEAGCAIVLVASVFTLLARPASRHDRRPKSFT
ncbi:hypothetical protein [Variovorax rhizosphaerae]|uniref:Uncharacterized protein n=1 Tax=Variovorax rhizosphaerae TaxID=1836200 RepID=A0ABU8WME9_9BURK